MFRQAKTPPEDGTMGKKRGSCTGTLMVLLAVVGVVFIGLSVGFIVSLYTVQGSLGNGGAKHNGDGTTKAPIESETASTGPRGSGTTPSGPQIAVRVTVENIITNDDNEFRATKLLQTTKKSAYEIMRHLEKIDSRFRFTTKENKDFGHMVTHVQGVKSDWNEKTYWAFLKRTDTVDCYLSLGVSSYIPSDGEHLVLSLQKYPNNVKSCLSLAKTTKSPPESETTAARATQTPDAARATPSGPQVAVRFTFENVVTNDRREFRATTDTNTTQKSAYEIMRDIEKTDSRFRFTTKEHKDFGHMVTHVQGVEAVWATDKAYWAFLKRTEIGDCLVSLGVSSYIPSDGEHLVLSLTKYPNNLKSCLNLAKTTPSPPELITIVYTVESNYSTSPADGDFPASITWNTTRKVFLKIMEDVQATNHTSFRFDVDANQAVTRVQNSQATTHLHWMLLLRDVTASYCTVTEGVSAYTPKDKDHLVLSLEKPDAHPHC
ncbi:hypothetical protein LSAT2_008928 [Lamellibrachia satsuma]|nr:hypothetical protein LSAT2_008928 [Lamellibrachia satsuma]